jgi:hypothetical protein
MQLLVAGCLVFLISVVRLSDPHISPVAVNRASVPRCHWSLPSAVGRCCCCQPKIVSLMPGIVRGAARARFGMDATVEVLVVCKYSEVLVIRFAVALVDAT